MHTLLTTTALSALLLAPGAFAQSCSGHSPAHTVALLELYTSEGCSSCPPADRFLSQIASGPRSAEAVLPLSLHVDYWNHIGWKDPFSSATFTARQRALSAQAGTRVIYTPEVFIGGREVRNWAEDSAAAVRRINAQPARAAIAIALARTDAQQLHLEVTGKAPAGARLQVALLQNGLAVRVGAGENGGRTLHHDAVARRWFSAAPAGAGGALRLVETLRLDDAVTAGSGGSGNYAVAAFVQAADGEILQAYSLPVCAAGQAAGHAVGH